MSTIGEISEYKSLQQECCDISLEDRNREKNSNISLTGSRSLVYSSCDDGELSEENVARKDHSDVSSTKVLFHRDFDSSGISVLDRNRLPRRPWKRRSCGSKLEFRKKIKIFKDEGETGSVGSIPNTTVRLKKLEGDGSRHRSISPDFNYAKEKGRISEVKSGRPENEEVDNDPNKFSESIFKVFLKPDPIVKRIPKLRSGSGLHTVRSENLLKCRGMADYFGPNRGFELEDSSRATLEDCGDFREDLSDCKSVASFDTDCSKTTFDYGTDVRLRLKEKSKSLSPRRSVHWRDEVTLIHRSSSNVSVESENETPKASCLKDNHEIMDVGRTNYGKNVIQVMNAEVEEPSFNNINFQRALLSRAKEKLEKFAANDATNTLIVKKNSQAGIKTPVKKHLLSDFDSIDELITKARYNRLASTGRRPKKFSSHSFIGEGIFNNPGQVEGSRSSHVMQKLVPQAGGEIGSLGLQFQCGENVLQEDVSNCAYEEIRLSAGAENSNNSSLVDENKLKKLKKPNDKAFSNSLVKEPKMGSKKSLKECMEVINSMKMKSSCHNLRKKNREMMQTLRPNIAENQDKPVAKDIEPDAVDELVEKIEKLEIHDKIITEECKDELISNESNPVASGNPSSPVVHQLKPEWNKAFSSELSKRTRPTSARSMKILKAWESTEKAISERSERILSDLMKSRETSEESNFEKNLPRKSLSEQPRIQAVGKEVEKPTKSSPEIKSVEVPKKSATERNVVQNLTRSPPERNAVEKPKANIEKSTKSTTESKSSESPVKVPERVAVKSPSSRRSPERNTAQSPIDSTPDKTVFEQPAKSFPERSTVKKSAKRSPDRNTVEMPIDSKLDRDVFEEPAKYFPERSSVKNSARRSPERNVFEQHSKSSADRSTVEKPFKISPERRAVEQPIERNTSENPSISEGKRKALGKPIVSVERKTFVKYADNDYTKEVDDTPIQERILQPSISINVRNDAETRKEETVFLFPDPSNSENTQESYQPEIVEQPNLQINGSIPLTYIPTTSNVESLTVAETSIANVAQRQDQQVVQMPWDSSQHFANNCRQFVLLGSPLPVQTVEVVERVQCNTIRPEDDNVSLCSIDSLSSNDGSASSSSRTNVPSGISGISSAESSGLQAVRAMQRPPSRKPFFERNAPQDTALTIFRSRVPVRSLALQNFLPNVEQEPARLEEILPVKPPPPPRMYSTLKEGAINRNQMNERIREAILALDVPSRNSNENFRICAGNRSNSTKSINRIASEKLIDIQKVTPRICSSSAVKIRPITPKNTEIIKKALCDIDVPSLSVRLPRSRSSTPDRLSRFSQHLENRRALISERLPNYLPPWERLGLNNSKDDVRSSNENIATAMPKLVGRSRSNPQPSRKQCTKPMVHQAPPSSACSDPSPNLRSSRKKDDKKISPLSKNILQSPRKCDDNDDRPSSPGSSRQPGQRKQRIFNCNKPTDNTGKTPENIPVETGMGRDGSLANNSTQTYRHLRGNGEMNVAVSIRTVYSATRTQTR